MSTAADRRAIDELTAAFFDAFTNTSGTAANIDGLFDLFIREALIVNNVGGASVVYDLNGFIEPRRAILTDGSLKDFREQETSERTQIFGNIAQRFSTYKKSWTASGAHFTGSGAKSIQCIRTPAGWKIASLVWDDD